MFVFDPQPKEKLCYENYLLMHTGELADMLFSREELVVMLSRNIAAFELLKAQKAAAGTDRAPAFDVMEIHEQGEAVREMYAIDDLPTAELCRLLQSPETVAGAKEYAYLYSFTSSDDEETDGEGGGGGISYADLARELEDLREQMERLEQKTERYKELLQKITRVIELKDQSPDAREQQRLEMIKKRREALFALVHAADVYMMGKKKEKNNREIAESVRHALEVLALTMKHQPKLRRKVQRLVRRINQARGARPGDPHYVSLEPEGYGRSRTRAGATRSKNI
ncbi:MAG: hypothetical protein IKS07_07635 [Lachnospiraceae bacterium]|nr:hypothetical protein [Lachnospiraceae bacterium]